MGVSLQGPNGSIWYTAEEAADKLHLKNADSIHKAVERGHLVPHEFGNMSVFNSRDLEVYVLTRRRPGRPKGTGKKSSAGRSRRAS